ncbi:MAG: hypothetical protein M0R47_20705 [Methylobacter sp.]|uniref:hypothetical protein n=1 Tax=Methylobacter sp. TaxID=2051955 RepID=UPI0025D7F76E|nr:hypothetical protein [Methylobacter sp.]MCK9622943.1 hypothetical protein [Methylobacter sp.]
MSLTNDHLTQREEGFYILRLFRLYGESAMTNIPVDKKKTYCLSAVAITGALLTGCATETPKAPPMTDRTTAYVEYVRADMRQDKVVMINQAMKLDQNDPNYNAFWHEYYPYEAELKKLNDERLALIRDYQYNLNNMTDDTANNLAKRAIAIREKKLELLKEYYKKIKKATSPIIAAKFLQVEYEIGLLLDLEIASNMPLLKKSPQE